MPKKSAKDLAPKDLKPGLRFRHRGVDVEILRGRETAQDRFGQPLDRWWSRDLGTGNEGYISLGPTGKFYNVEILSAATTSRSRHHTTKKAPAQLQREIDEALTKPVTARTYEIAFKKKGSGRLKWVAVEADNITDASMKARTLMATRYPGKGYVEYGHSRDPNVST